MNKQKITVLIILVLISSIVGVKLLLKSKPVDFDPQVARSKGNALARVKIIEFIDFQCPACSQGSKILKDFTTAFPQDIYLQVKYFPLTNMHAHAIMSAMYSECAARQGKFWDLHELMMLEQGQWEQLLNPDPVFRAMASQVGINQDQLNVCMASDGLRRLINDEKSIGQSLGVSSTPTYFINKKMVVGTKSLLEELHTYFPSTNK